jgi:tetratricopeptide (TPR) repeat protein
LKINSFIKIANTFKYRNFSFKYFDYKILMHTKSQRNKVWLLIPILLFFFACSKIACAQFIPSDTSKISLLIKNAEKNASVFPDSSVYYLEKAVSAANAGINSAANSQLSDKLLIQLIGAELSLGRLYYDKADFEKSLQHNERALENAKKSGEARYIGESLFYLGENLLEQCRFSNAMEKYREAITYYTQIKDDGSIFWCYSGMGIVQKNAGNYDDAIVCFRNALTYAEKGKLIREEASCFNNIGNVYRRQGDFPKAMDAYQKALNQFNSLKNELSASDCMNNIGNLYLDMNDPFRALNYFNQSLRIIKNRDDNYRLIVRYKNMAEAYTDLKDFDNAVQFLEDAIKLSEKSGNKSYLASCYSQFGKLQAAKGEYSISIAYHKKAATLLQEIGAKADEAEALYELASTEKKDGLINDAIEHASEAVKLAESAGALSIRLQANKCLADCYEQKGDSRQATYYLKQAIQLKDSIYTIEKYRTIEEIESGFKRNELKNENQVLIQNSILQKQAIRSKNLLAILLGISLILSIALIWMSVNRYRNSKIEALRVQNVKEQQIEKLNENLKEKERELTSKTIFINQKNQLLEKLIGELEQLKKNDISANSINHLQTELKQELSPDSWKEFEIQFNEVHPGFQNQLLNRFPELSPSERRLCSFLRLDMNTREIASLTGQTFKSIEVARTRIRKKMNLSREENLPNFIAAI